MSSLSVARSSVRLTGVLAFLCLLASCPNPAGGSGGTPPGPPPGPTDPIPPEEPPVVEFVLAERSGMLALPGGLPAGCRVVGAAGSAAPGADGSFSLACWKGGSALAAAETAAGEPLAVGWMEEGAGPSRIDARSTAEVLLFFGLNGPTRSEADRAAMRKLIAAAPEAADFAAAVEARMLADPEVLGTQDAALQAALADAARKLCPDGASAPGAAPAAPPSRAVSIDPSQEKSGVYVVQDGVNGVKFVNSFRRRVHVWVDRTGYVPAGGGAWVRDGDVPVGVVELPPVNGLKSFLGTLNDLASLKSFYHPVESPTLSLPVMPADAEKVEFRIVAVGPGTKMGDFLSLSPERQLEGTKASAAFFFFDLFLPSMLNVVAPQAKCQDLLKKVSLEGYKSNMIMKLVQDTPQLAEKIAAGDWAGAMERIQYQWRTEGEYRRKMMTFAATLATVKDAALDADALYKRWEDGLELMRKIMDNVKAVNGVLGFTDLAVATYCIQESNKREDWLIEITPPKVRLNPSAATVRVNGTASFSAALAEASGSGAPDLIYRWKCGGAFGSLSDGIHAGTDFESTRKDAEFKAGGAVGKDWVELEVLELRGRQRVSLGKVRAEVAVMQATVRIERVERDIHNNLDVTHLDVACGRAVPVRLKAIIDPPPEAGAVVFPRWTSGGKLGSLSNRLSETTLYAPGTAEGQDLVMLTVYHRLGGIDTEIGSSHVYLRLWKTPKPAKVSQRILWPRLVKHAWDGREQLWLVRGEVLYWPTPDGMHRYAETATAESFDGVLPQADRFRDTAKSKGLDLVAEFGVPEGWNYTVWTGMEEVYPEQDIQDLIDGRTASLRRVQADFEARDAYVYCSP